MRCANATKLHRKSRGEATRTPARLPMTYIAAHEVFAFLKWCGKPMRLQPGKRSIRAQGLHRSFHFLAQCGVVFRECDAELFVRRHLEGDR